MTLPDRICDPHHHLWDLSPARHYVVADLRADLATVANVTQTVFVECSAWYHQDGPEHLREVGETEWVASNTDAVVAGIVGATDLRLGSKTEVALHAHLDAAHGRFRGIRHRATWDASPQIKPSIPDSGPGLLRDPACRRGMAVLRSLGLVFDAWVYFPQLPDVVDLARTFPDLTIVLNHLGGPITLGPYHDRAAMLDRWRTLMTDVAACPNVVLKIGGIGMPIYGVPWSKQATAPAADEVAAFWRAPVQWCIEAFGAQRCMFESNFPVDRLSMSYATLWEAFDLLSTTCSPAERSALFHDTAVTTYRLDKGTS